MSKPLPQIVHDQIRNARSRLARTKVLVGFDGFVDTILHVVARRESVTKYTRVEQMREFSEKIGEAAGLSANFEMVTQMVKLGGNGPIMANALCSYGTPLTYIGNLGQPHVHPVFADLVKRAKKIYSIAEPAYTDAVEFADGKLMFGKHQSLRDVNWPNLIQHVPEEKLLGIFAQSSLIALVNWTMLTHLTSIWQKIATRIAPQLTGEKRWLFVDLADPAKRSPEDQATALQQITRFQKHFRVILGMNLREARQIGEVLGLKAPEETYGTVTQHADDIRKKLKIDTVVIHPTFFAAAANAQGAMHVLGPVTTKPKITTGAGDHFNAGFCLGCLLGLDLAGCLQIGVATSGFYVRNAKSPQLDDLQKFLLTL
ncbi:MAG: PfkB family carbohydrate kinase [Chthoniobacter sp.]|uniref:PfkB family carbohydrate kinase n=1 Tax=Chthoniobacter sp. TaxID=2510640 RepID=UPI0032A9FE58